MSEHRSTDDRKVGNRQASNRKTGLVIGALALFFFVAVFVKRIWLS